MVAVDLITGFLGAGKTTFIHRYLHYLKDMGQRVHIIENEFGPISVDSSLLKKDTDGCGISDLTGLCMCCVGKTAFIDALEDAANAGIDRIIVEPSGIYDVDEFFSVMENARVRGKCEIGSIITIADAEFESKLTEECRYLMFCQLAASGCVVMSKTQLTEPAKIEETKEQLDSLMRSFGCEEGLTVPVYEQAWSALTDDELSRIMAAGFERSLHERKIFSHSETFQSATTLCRAGNLTEVKTRVQRLFDSPDCGLVYRVKGIVPYVGNHCCEVNCTRGIFSVTPCYAKKGLLVVIGQHLDEDRIREICMEEI